MGDQNKNVPRLRFPGYTDAWVKCELGDVVDIVGGGTPSTSVIEYWNGEINWYSPVEIGNQIYVSNSQNKITKLGLEKSSAKILPAYKTILFTSRAGIGNTAIITSDGATNQGFQSLVIKEKMDLYFLYTTSYKIKEMALQIASGSTFLEISGKSLSKLEILLPNFEEQTKIGKFFKQLDNLITVNERELNKLRNLKKSYLEKMFPKNGSDIPELRFPCYTDAWVKCKLGEETSLITKGTTPKNKLVNGDVNFVKVEDIIGGKIYPRTKISSYENDNYLKRSKLKENDILFSIAGTLGRTASVDKSILPANTNQALAIIRGYSFDKNYLMTVLNSYAVAKYIQENPTVGAQPNLSLRQVGKMIFEVPSITEQIMIGNFFRNIDNLITVNERELNKLKELKKSYLKDMFV